MRHLHRHGANFRIILSNKRYTCAYVTISYIKAIVHTEDMLLITLPLRRSYLAHFETLTNISHQPSFYTTMFPNRRKHQSWFLYYHRFSHTFTILPRPLVSLFSHSETSPTLSVGRFLPRRITSRVFSPLIITDSSLTSTQITLFNFLSVFISHSCLIHILYIYDDGFRMKGEAEANLSVVSSNPLLPKSFFKTFNP